MASAPLRPARHRAGWTALLLVVTSALAIVGCSGGGGRPSTDATVEILSPAPNAVVAPHVELTVRLNGARLVPPSLSNGAIRGSQGHIHLLLDGDLVAMPYQLKIDLGELAPGPHTVEAEFVASDHLPFSNRPVATVSFDVR